MNRSVEIIPIIIIIIIIIIIKNLKIKWLEPLDG